MLLHSRHEHDALEEHRLHSAWAPFVYILDDVVQYRIIERLFVHDELTAEDTTIKCCCLLECMASLAELEEASEAEIRRSEEVERQVRQQDDSLVENCAQQIQVSSSGILFRSKSAVLLELKVL